MVVRGMVVRAMVVRAMVVRPMVMCVMVVCAMVVCAMVVRAMVVRAMVVRAMVMCAIVVRAMVVSVMVVRAMVVCAMVVRAMVVSVMIVCVMVCTCWLVCHGMIVCKDVYLLTYSMICPTHLIWGRVSMALAPPVECLEMPRTSPHPLSWVVLLKLQQQNLGRSSSQNNRLVSQQYSSIITAFLLQNPALRLSKCMQ